MKTFLAVAVLMLGTAAQPGHAGSDDDAVAGQGFSARQAAALEAQVARDPEDLSARTKLLGYYLMASARTEVPATAARPHILWIIENHPEAGIAGSPYVDIDPRMDKIGYDEARRLWLEQTRAHPFDAAVLGHAAHFFELHDAPTAINLLRQAQDLAPRDPQWPEQLGRIYGNEDGKDAAAMALDALERAQLEDISEVSRMYRLDALAKVAFNAEEPARASRYANQSLSEAQKLPKDWNYGNAIHHANIVLGRIALKRGDIRQADAYLLKAGRTPGSPQLDSFGPSMTLASDLLAAGEKKTVLQYFALCRKFWKGGGATLDGWEQQVKAGKTPDFGPNMRY